jgi:hypothetical protein
MTMNPAPTPGKLPIVSGPLLLIEDLQIAVDPDPRRPRLSSTSYTNLFGISLRCGYGLKILLFLNMSHFFLGLRWRHLHIAKSCQKPQSPNFLPNKIPKFLSGLDDFC